MATNGLLATARAEQQENALPAPQAGEDAFAYIQRLRGRFDSSLYLKILGSANDFKEGDVIVGVAADSAQSRTIARTLLSNTRLEDIDAHPPWTDELAKFIANRPRKQLKIFSRYARVVLMMGQSFTGI